MGVRAPFHRLTLHTLDTTRCCLSNGLGLVARGFRNEAAALYAGAAGGLAVLFRPTFTLRPLLTLDDPANAPLIQLGCAITFA